MLDLEYSSMRLHEVFCNVMGELYVKTFDMDKEAFKTYLMTEIGLEEGEWEEIEDILPEDKK